MTSSLERSALVVAVILACASGVGFAGEARPGEDLLDLMAQGKTETELGNYEAAIAALTAIVDSPEAPPAVHAEGLVRLGAARRGAGDREGAYAAFDRAAKAPGLDRETKALLVRALGGVVPGAVRWAAIWPQVSFTPDRSHPKGPTLAIVWPGVPRARRVYSGAPISLHFQDGNLQDIFRLFADISGLNVVVFPGVDGLANMKVNQEPWDDVLERILAANGLGYRLEDNVLLIALPEMLGPERRYAGRRIDVDWRPDADPFRPGRGRDLREALAEIAAAGNATVVLDPAADGGVVLKLDRVRWDQAFDTVVRVNGLDWTREGSMLKVFPRRNPRP
jgi:Secretin and TonB N terminus short domain